MPAQAAFLAVLLTVASPFFQASHFFCLSADAASPAAYSSDSSEEESGLDAPEDTEDDREIEDPDDPEDAEEAWEEDLDDPEDAENKDPDDPDDEEDAWESGLDDPEDEEYGWENAPDDPDDAEDDWEAEDPDDPHDAEDDREAEDPDENPEGGDWEEEADEWPSDGIASRIPVPDADMDTFFLHCIHDTQFDASIAITAEAFAQYVEDCEAWGFDRDQRKHLFDGEDDLAASFYALDDDGYKLKLEYSGETGEEGSLYISLRAPIPLVEIHWPDYALGLLLPPPPTTLGRIGGSPEIFLVSYLGNMPPDAYSAYLEACKDAGFDQNAMETETEYTAYDEDGIELNLNYEGGSVVYLQLFDPEQKWRSRGTGGDGEDSNIVTPGQTPPADSLAEPVPSETAAAAGAAISSGAGWTDKSPGRTEKGIGSTGVSDKARETAGSASRGGDSPPTESKTNLADHVSPMISQANAAQANAAQEASISKGSPQESGQVPASSRFRADADGKTTSPPTQITRDRSASSSPQTQNTGSRSASSSPQTQITGSRSASSSPQTQITGSRSASSSSQVQKTAEASARTSGSTSHNHSAENAAAGSAYSGNAHQNAPVGQDAWILSEESAARLKARLAAGNLDWLSAAAGTSAAASVLQTDSNVLREAASAASDHTVPGTFSEASEPQNHLAGILAALFVVASTLAGALIRKRSTNLDRL